MSKSKTLVTTSPWEDMQCGVARPAFRVLGENERPTQPTRPKSATALKTAQFDTTPCRCGVAHSGCGVLKMDAADVAAELSRLQTENKRLREKQQLAKDREEALKLEVYHAQMRYNKAEQLVQELTDRADLSTQVKVEMGWEQVHAMRQQCKDLRRERDEALKERKTMREAIKGYEVQQLTEVNQEQHEELLYYQQRVKDLEASNARLEKDNKRMAAQLHKTNPTVPAAVKAAPSYGYSVKWMQ